MADLYIEKFISYYSKTPKKIILDIDDTNADTYGNQ